MNSELLSEVAFALCLDTLGGGSDRKQLHMHVSKPPKDDSTAGRYLNDSTTFPPLEQLLTVGIWIPNFLKFGFQMVWYSNGRFMDYILCTRPTILIPEQSKENKMASICLPFKWLGCLIFKWHSKNNIWQSTSFWLFEYQTSSVFRSPLYRTFENQKHSKTNHCGVWI